MSYESYQNLECQVHFAASENQHVGAKDNKVLPKGAKKHIQALRFQDSARKLSLTNAPLRTVIIKECTYCVKVLREACKLWTDNCRTSI